MGNQFFRRESVEFILLPSQDKSGPLGLGDPDNEEISRVEEESIIPALMHDRLRTKHCLKFWDEVPMDSVIHMSPRLPPSAGVQQSKRSAVPRGNEEVVLEATFRLQKNRTRATSCTN
ncbi:unnamed protein product [Heterobilharzia americana]|nr:unnamed protein product [Heterobilharzia americana]CAH8460095.1 unnamed protein product [Heterobilharzia americana]